VGLEELLVKVETFLTNCAAMASNGGKVDFLMLHVKIFFVKDVFASPTVKALG